MLPLSSDSIKKFQDKILLWYSLNQRDLPWRKTRNPYHILVSEIMLQQTQVNRVIPKFNTWLEALPTVNKLADAPVSQVLTLWAGLGYNRRALNLKKTAQIIAEKYKGQFPQTEKDLFDLPGIGQYTARAILCFAFDKQVAVVDTNVKKVILTQFINNYGVRIGENNTRVSLSEKEFLTIAEQLLPQGKAYEWNQALMDYANTVLKKEKIYITKQSKFHGSRRFYRGKILKVLLENKTIRIVNLGQMIKEDYAASEKAWLDSLVHELVKEGFVLLKNNTITLAE